MDACLQVVEPVAKAAVEFSIDADVFLGAAKVPKGSDAETKACFKASCQPGLVMANRAVLARNINPVLNHVRLTGVHGCGLTIQSTDGEFSIKQFLPIGWTPHFDVLVPMASLMKLVKMFKGKELTVTVTPGADSVVPGKNKESGTITIATNKSSYDLTTIDPENFPDLFGEVEFERVLDLDCESLKRILNRVNFCAVREDSAGAVHYTNGVYMVRKGERFDVVATDGHRLALQREGVGGGGADAEALIPARVAAQLEMMLPDCDDRSMGLWVYDTGTDVHGSLRKPDDTVLANTVQFQWATDLGEVQVFSSCLDVKFPDYDRCIPKDCESTIYLDRQNLIQGLNRVLFMCSQKDQNPVAFFEWENDHLVVTGDAGEIGKGSETFDCEIKGEAGKVAVNPKYVLDFLKKVGGEQVYFQVLNEVNPLTLKTPREPGFTYIVMPIRMD